MRRPVDTRSRTNFFHPPSSHTDLHLALPYLATSTGKNKGCQLYVYDPIIQPAKRAEPGLVVPGLVVPGLTEAVVPHKDLSGFATFTGKNKRMPIVCL